MLSFFLKNEKVDRFVTDYVLAGFLVRLGAVIEKLLVGSDF